MAGLPKRLALWIVPLAFATWTSAAEVDRLLPAKPRGEVEIEVAAGSLRVVGEDRSDVAVRGTLGDGASGLDTDVDGRWIRLVVAAPRPEVDGAPGPRSDLEVRVPFGNAVTVKTFSADVAVEGVSGELSLETASGGVTVDGSPRAATVRTVSGAVSLDVSSAVVRIDNVSGPVTVAGDIEDLAAEIVDGSLAVSARIRNEARLGSVVGDVGFEGTLDPVARLRVEGSTADLELALPEHVEVAVEAVGGVLESEGGPSFTAERGERLRREHTFGDGGPIVAVSTFGGRVRLTSAP